MKNPTTPARLEPVNDSLLDLTMRSAIKDQQTVSPEGKSIHGLIEGVTFWEVTTHIDERGSVVELFDPRWNWHPEPLVFAYVFTLRPGFVKGWGLHQLHEDRYFLLQGEMELILYDVRPDSSTCGNCCRIILSGHNRRLVNIPKYVWHADHNIGNCDVVCVNFPTTPYDHANPDKYRLPIDTPLIPFSFPGARGG